MWYFLGALLRELIDFLNRIKIADLAHCSALKNKFTRIIHLKSVSNNINILLKKFRRKAANSVQIKRKIIIITSYWKKFAYSAQFITKNDYSEVFAKAQSDQDIFLLSNPGSVLFGITTKFLLRIYHLWDTPIPSEIPKISPFYFFGGVK